MEIFALKDMPAQDRAALLDTLRRRQYDRRETIIREGDEGFSVHIIEKGHVLVHSLTPNGDLVVLSVLGPGDVFGEMAIVSDQYTRMATCVALDDCTTLSLHRDHFEQLRKEHPAVDRVIVNILSAHIRRLAEQLEEALYESVDTRVARRLLNLHDAFHEGEIPLTQEEISAIAGTTRVSVNRILAELEQKGVLERRRGRIRVVDSSALEDFAIGFD